MKILKILGLALSMILHGCVGNIGSSHSDISEPGAKKISQKLISQRLKEVKDQIIREHTDAINILKTKIHDATGISAYHLYRGILNDDLKWKEPINKAKICYERFIRATKTREEIENNTLIPGWFNDENRNSVAPNIIQRNLGLDYDLRDTKEVNSVIAIGPYKPIGYLQNGFMVKELVDKYGSDEYAVFVNNVNDLWIGHLPSIENFFTLNQEANLLNVFGIEIPEQIVEKLAQQKFTNNDLAKDAIAALFGDPWDFTEGSVLKRSRELETIHSAYREDKGIDYRMLAYQLANNLSEIPEELQFFADEFQCRHN